MTSAGHCCTPSWRAIVLRDTPRRSNSSTIMRASGPGFLAMSEAADARCAGRLSGRLIDGSLNWRGGFGVELLQRGGR